MRYVINEHQYKLLLEQEDILRIPFAAFGNNWNVLQKFMERRGNPSYMITDDLDLRGTNIESLGNLTSVEGSLYLSYSKIKSLGNLTSVGGSLFLAYTGIKNLGNLTSVGGSLNLFGVPIESLGNLKTVGYDLDLQNTPLSIKYSEEEIHSMVEVGGEIYFEYEIYN